jgi:DNA repair protein RecO
LRRGSKLAAAVQPLAFSDMTRYHSRDRWTLTEAQTIELFDGLSADLKLLALGSYFAELMEAVSDEDSPNPALLNLGLNALFLLSENEKNPLLIKAAFEMRLMCLAGYEPAVSECAVCGRDDIIAPFWTSRAERCSASLVKPRRDVRTVRRLARRVALYPARRPQEGIFVQADRRRTDKAVPRRRALCRGPARPGFQYARLF